VICSLKYRGRSEPNKYHRGQKCPDEDNWFPRDENKQSHTTTPRTNGGAIASIISPKPRRNYDFLARLLPCRAYESARFKSADKSMSAVAM
jgi:hypothetical protein